MPAWADRNLRVILAARAGMSVGRATSAVITALYLSAIGFSGVEIGLLFVGVTIVSAVLSTAIGLFADRWGRKPFLVAMPLITAAAGLVFAEVRVTAVLFLAAALGSFGRGAGAGGGSVGPYQPAEAAMVADIARGPRRAVAFSRISFASTFGALIGGLLAELVQVTPHMTDAQATAAYRPAFLLAAGCAVFAGLVALLLREPKRGSAHGGRRHVRVRWPRRSWPALWRFWVTNGTNGAAIGLFGPFISYWMFRRYGVAPGTIGVLFAIVNLGSLASILTAARVGRRIGTVPAIVLTRGIAGAMLIPMVLAPSFWIAGAVYFVRMLIQRVGFPLRQSFTQDMADPEERASVAALSNLPSQATMGGGQAIAGYLFDEVSLSAPFELAALFQLANAGLYVLLFWLRPPRTGSQRHAGAPAAAAVLEPASALAGAPASPGAAAAAIPGAAAAATPGAAPAAIPGAAAATAGSDPRA